ncbi:Hypothetical_protein [Hexamita inflata]|uniref:Hypothetical_protein n=1 Tax=Hexamita inflata TaxID=28002 RepID=A0AA86TXN8_9EUKA|nr:Hypothetical protein HINF_LOCUS19891 [Hexamita inflata]
MKKMTKRYVSKNKTAMNMKNVTGIISREFYLGTTIIKQVQNSISTRKTRYANAVVIMNNSQLYFTTTNIGDMTDDFYQVQVELAVGAPRFFPDQHQEILSLQSLVYFPGNVKYGVEGKYCFDQQLKQSQTQMYETLYKEQKQTTAIVNMMGTQIAISQLKIESNKSKINYMAITSVFIVSSSIVWFTISYKQLK